MAVRAFETARSTRVLIADDYAPNLVVLQALLEPLDAAVMTARTATQAVELASCYRFSAILMDVRMGEISGLQAANLIRLSPLNADTPIVFVTGAAPEQDELDSVRGEPCDVLLKPFSSASLLAKVAPLIERARPEHAARVSSIPQR